MPFDLADHLGAMTRVVTRTEHDGKPALAVIASRVFDTDADDLWDAVTSKERIPRWFLPISGDLELGGRYQFEGNAGGTITACEPPRTLSVTWEFGGGVSWVNLVLSPVEGGTRLQLEHLAESDDNPHLDKFGPGAVGVGWDLGFLGLARHIAEPDNFSRPPEADEAWAVSDEAKTIYRLSSDDWCRAAIEAGTPAAKARAAAELTRAFYSGETPPDEA